MQLKPNYIIMLIAYSDCCVNQITQKGELYYVEEWWGRLCSFRKHIELLLKVTNDHI